MTSRERLDRWREARHQTTADVEARYGNPPPAVRGTKTPLTTNQHILHLLLTVFTCGLWLPVWIVRASQGNRA